MTITGSLKIDLVDRVVLPPVHAVQCDANTRAVAVTLTAGGVAWEPPGEAQISVAFKKPDGKKGWYNELPDGSSACSVSGNVVTAILAPEVLTAAGKVDAVIVFQDKDLHQLATFGFVILVEPNPAAGREISNDYYNYSTMEAVNQAMDSFFTQAEADYGAFTQKVETEQAAFLETATQALTEMHSTVTADAPGVVCEASGEVIAVADSSDRMLQGLRIFGRTVQDGTPSPDAPVELVSVGNSGSVGLTVAGKNLLDISSVPSITTNEVTFTVQPDGGIKVTGTATSNSWLRNANIIHHVSLGAGEYVLSGVPKGSSIRAYLVLYTADGTGLTAVQDSGSGAVYVIEEAVTGYFQIVVPKGNTADTTFYPQLEIGTVATTYEPCKPAQALIVSTPHGLPGIPVTSGGNYTDADGQQWVCDEVDFVRGVYVQNVNLVQFTGDETFNMHLAGVYFTNKVELPATYGQSYPSLCSHFTYSGADNLYGSVAHRFAQAEKTKTVYFSDPSITTLEGFVSFVKSAYATGNPLTVAYTLAEPIETPLSAEELAAYAALHTNKPNTTGYNDAGAHMELSYVADTKLYIDNKIAAIAAAVLNNT